MSRVRESVSERIVRRVADVTDSNGCDLPLLYEAVDPDALDALVAHMETGTVTFEYAGSEVTVESCGTISVVGDATSRASHAAVGDD